ncbi:MAG TPA: GNAT family N-acetyltransferase [Solirubrobacteraceae bacterium]|jgi:predicted GNAT family acetyltransferase|nr:GNAT family N-acetyltransferase [Solirubrobacteraceae bacterium]
MGPLRFVLTADTERFAARAESFLTERIERNVMATILVRLRNGQVPGASPLFALGEDGDGVLRAVAMRTPPWLLLVSDLDPADARSLIATWSERDPAPPGVTGTPPSARAVAAAWAAHSGGRAHCSMVEAMHVLEAVRDPPRPAQGSVRQPRPEERETLIQWLVAFAAEATRVGGTGVARVVDSRMADGSAQVWDDGEAVSLVMTSPQIAGTVRIGPVYTPPERRGHGYASAAVAAVSRLALARGAERCMLYTDVANPTSNKIYADVGYRRVGDWEEHTFQA